MLEAIQVILENVGIKRDHQRLFLRALWVLGVSGHVAWICGFLTVAGLNSPFVRAEDIGKVEQKVTAVEQKVTALERSSQVSARIQLQGEIRAQTKAYCGLRDPVEREYVLRRIDSLRAELFEIAKLSTPEPNCPPSGIPE